MALHETIQQFRPVPGGPRSVAELSFEHPDPTMELLVCKSGSYTYAQIGEIVKAASSALWAQGLRPGDHVAASAYSDRDLIVAYLASMRLGLIWVGINRVLAPVEKAYILENSETSFFIGDPDMVEQVRSQKGDAVRTIAFGDGPGQWASLLVQHANDPVPDVQIDPFVPAAIAYTSGTTGRPKGAIHTQHSMVTFPSAAFGIGLGGTWERTARRTPTMPMTILNGLLFGPVSALIGRGTHVCLDKLDVLSVAEAIDRHGIEVIQSTPTTVHDLLFHPSLNGKRFQSLKSVSAGGSYVSEELKDAFRERYEDELHEEYGLSESPAGIINSRPGHVLPPGSSGWAYPHVEAHILGPDDQILPVGEIGELALRGVTEGTWAGVYSPMLGYWKDAEQTAAVLKNGWLLTGDLARMDEQKRVFIVGRKKEVIVRGGANVYPAEVERVLKRHPQVEEAVLIGMPDKRLGERAAAFLLVSGGTKDLKKELSALCRENLAVYKLPEFWYTVAEIPRNAMNKPDRSRIKALPRTELP